MTWLTLMTLSDGSEVQSRMAAPPDRGAASRGRDYRVRRTDGSVVEFATMLDVTRYLQARYDVDETHVGGRRTRSSGRA